MFATPMRRGHQPDDSQELRRDRARNDRRLKTTFERIFEKYNRDFSEVGDEIDLVTGEVVRDNGHLAGMQHERDVGSSASKRFVRAFTQELGGEDHIESRARRQMSQVYRASQAPDSSGPDTDSEDELSSPTRGNSEDTVPSTQLQTLQQQTASSLMAVAQQGTANRPIDPDAIQSLGTALAAQIATFLNQQLRGQLLPAQAQQLTAQILPMQNNKWAYPALTPARFTQGRPEYPTSPTPSMRSLSPLDATSLWATSRRGRPRGFEPPAKRQRLLAYDAADEPWPSVEDNPYEGDNTADELSPEADYPPEPAVDASEVPTAEDAAFYESLVDEMTAFGEAAKFNFQILAHGFANRGHMTVSEVAPILKRSHLVDGAGRFIVRDPTKSATWGLKRFTRQEDATIIMLKGKKKMPWSQIATYFPDRTEASLQVRWNRSLKEGSARFNRGYVVDLDEEELAIEVPDTEEVNAEDPDRVREVSEMDHDSNATLDADEDIVRGVTQPAQSATPGPGEFEGASSIDLLHLGQRQQDHPLVHATAPLPHPAAGLRTNASAASAFSGISRTNQADSAAPTANKRGKGRPRKQQPASNLREPGVYDRVVEESEVWTPDTNTYSSTGRNFGYSTPQAIGPAAAGQAYTPMTPQAYHIAPGQAFVNSTLQGYPIAAGQAYMQHNYPPPPPANAFVPPGMQYPHPYPRHGYNNPSFSPGPSPWQQFSGLRGLRTVNADTTDADSMRSEQTPAPFMNRPAAPPVAIPRAAPRPQASTAARRPARPRKDPAEQRKARKPTNTAETTKPPAATAPQQRKQQAPSAPARSNGAQPKQPPSKRRKRAAQAEVEETPEPSVHDMDSGSESPAPRVALGRRIASISTSPEVVDRSYTYGGHGGQGGQGHSRLGGMVRHATPDTSISSVEHAPSLVHHQARSYQHQHQQQEQEKDQSAPPPAQYGFALDPALGAGPPTHFPGPLQQAYQRIKTEEPTSSPAPPERIAVQTPIRAADPGRGSLEPQYPSPPDRNGPPSSASVPRQLPVGGGGVNGFSHSSARGGGEEASLRSSVLRKTFGTPRAQSGGSVVSRGSGASWRTGPVPVEDASDDEL